MRKTLRNIIIILPAVAAMVLAGSCARKSVVMNNVDPTKGCDGEEAIAFNFKSGKINEALTKGTPVVDTNRFTLMKGDYYGIDIQTVVTTVNDEKAFYFKDVLTDWTLTGTPTDTIPVSATWKNNSGPYYWPKSLPLDFWAITPAGEVSKSVTDYTVDKDNGKATFDYVTPKGTESDPASAKDATAQKDLMVAYEGGVYYGTHEGYADLKFQHLLSGIRFKAGKVSAGKLGYISINKVVSSASGTYTPPTFEWTLKTGSATDSTSYTQAFNLDLLECQEIETEDDYQKISLTDTTSTFMLLPQDIENVTLTVEFDGTVYENVKIYIPEDDPDGRTAHTEWRAGDIYTYILNISGGNVYVDLEEDFNHQVKKNVVSVNTGKQDSYMRVAVVANWIDKDGNIVESCDWMTEGSLVEPAWTVSGDGQVWKMLSDGYFYYKHAVAKREEIKEGSNAGKFTCYTTTNLFTSYTPPTPPREGLDLEMVIIAQAVQFDKNKTYAGQAWGEAAKAWFDTTVDKGQQIIREVVPEE